MRLTVGRSVPKSTQLGNVPENEEKAVKVLLVGAGAREHALAWKFRQSKLLGKLYLWPGNPGMRGCGEFLNAPASASYDDVLQKAKSEAIDLVVIGPEAPLSAGMADSAARMGFKVFGPGHAAAQLEASKAFAKSVMQAAKVPTAAYDVAMSELECTAKAKARLASGGGVVLKASGLAAGKGVFVCTTEAQLNNGLKHLYQTDMRQAAETVVIEELMVGRECSYFTLLGEAGRTQSLGFAVDYKRLQDGDQGPNTGGMGCYTGVPWLPANAAEQVESLVVRPVLAELAKRDIKYVGWLYVGLMWTEQGPRVVEFNVRLGDPEAQVLAVQNPSDWLAVIAGLLGLEPLQVASSNQKSVAVGVVMTSPNYPFGNDAVDESVALDFAAAQTANAQVFSASVSSTSTVIHPGKGRVLTAVGRGPTFAAARIAAYELVAKLRKKWPTAHFRTDIAKDL